MKKAVPKKSPKEKEEISKIVSEIVEENEKEEENEGSDEVLESEKSLPQVEPDENNELEPSPQELKENTQSASFYERVMGEKPPERKENTEEESKKERSINTKLFLLGAFVFVLTVLISSLVGLSILNKDILIKKMGVKPTVAPTTVPATPTPIEFARDEWTFEVLNGSSTPGLAAKASEKIKVLGYKVGKVGNADESVDTTQVMVSTDATDSEKDTILKDLKTDFGDLNFTDSLSDVKRTVRIILAK